MHQRIPFEFQIRFIIISKHKTGSYWNFYTIPKDGSDIQRMSAVRMAKSVTIIATLGHSGKIPT